MSMEWGEGPLAVRENFPPSTLKDGLQPAPIQNNFNEFNS